MNLLELHLTAFVAGAVLDLIIGDPHSIPHPVQFIGKLISFLDRKLQARAELLSAASSCSKAGYRQEGEDGARNRKRRYGRWMAFLVVMITAAVSLLILGIGYWIHPILGCALEAVMTCQILAGRSLERESMKVYRVLTHGTLEEARQAVSMIVGRDTQNLTAEQVTRAAVETVAENTSDGVIAPMLYTALGGPVLGWAYKAVNTMDSMVGYRNDRYIDFGRGPAHLDDVMNYLPSRISAVLMICGAWLLRPCGNRHGSGSRGGSGAGRQDSFADRGATAAGAVPDGFYYDAANAARIWKRDRRQHASPNSAQTESVMAGALRVQLAGDAFYFGKLVKKPLIGDPIRPIVPEDIPRANRLMFATAGLAELICVVLMLLVI